jgi:hypothetical protein
MLEVTAKSHRASIIPDSAQLEMIRGEGCNVRSAAASPSCQVHQGHCSLIRTCGGCYLAAVRQRHMQVPEQDIKYTCLCPRILSATHSDHLGSFKSSQRSKQPIFISKVSLDNGHHDASLRRFNCDALSDLPATITDELGARSFPKEP